MKIIIALMISLFLPQSALAVNAKEMQSNLDKTYLLDDFSDRQWSLFTPASGIDIEPVWTISKGSGVSVGVVDSGVDALHEDLSDNVEMGESFTGKEEYTDQNGHGTHVAGIIAAEQNDVGIEGIAPLAKIVPLQATNEKGVGPSSVIAKAFASVKQHNLKIVNASLGTYGFSQEMYNAIFDNPKTLFVVSAGNSKIDNEETPMFPCSFNLDNVLCVGASDEAAQVANFSNWGRDSVDIYAPGVNIFSTWPEDRYAAASGTSMSAPEVSAIAALVLSKHPNFTTAQIKASIVDSAVRSDAFSRSVSGGLVNAENALEAAEQISQGYETQSLKKIATPWISDEYIRRRCKTCKREKIDVIYKFISTSAAQMILQKRLDSWKTVKTVNLLVDGKSHAKTISARKGKYRLVIKAQNSNSSTRTSYHFQVR